jgi:hypothetical protein
MEATESIGVGSEEWALAHEALSKLRLKRAALDAEEGTWLLRAFRAATHVYFGYASFGEYIERLFGLRRRTTEEKLRVAGALEALPELAEALRSGTLNWSVVRELSRVAVPGTEREWILAVCRKTAREVERMVSGLAPGDRPADRRRPELVRHVLRFEVVAETLATFREAMKELQKQSDHRLDDDAALLLMARQVLGGPGDAGRASYQVVVTQCEDCGRGFQHASGELIELDRAIVEMCDCDAERIPIANLQPTIAQAAARVGAVEFGKTDARVGAVEQGETDARVSVEQGKAVARVGSVEQGKAGARERAVEFGRTDARVGVELGKTDTGVASAGAVELGRAAAHLGTWSSERQTPASLSSWERLRPTWVLSNLERQSPASPAWVLPSSARPGRAGVRSSCERLTAAWVLWRRE